MLAHKKNCKHIGLYQQPLTDIENRIYSSIAGDIIVQAVLPC